MSIQREGLSEAPVDYPRVIGHHRGDADGPTLLVVGGMHGNEPSGVIACQRLLDRLRALPGGFRGDFIALVGNTRALTRGVRFLELDLNRHWLPETVAALRATGSPRTAEDAEMLELLHRIDEAIENARGPVVFIDLHTSSAHGAPFVTIGDTLRNRSFARRFPLPVILGLEEQIDGALLEYMNNLGHTTFGVEAGQHASDDSVLNEEASLVLALIFAGCIDKTQVPDYDELYRMLQSRRGGVPRVIEVLFRHPIRHGDGFAMLPGFSNFDLVKKGQLLATDNDGQIHAEMDGRILLPLYQGQGDDGFFLCRRVHGVWLAVSRGLRRMRLDRFTHMLPGVRKHPGRADTLVVNTGTARFFPLQVFHLLGYRKLRRRDNVLLVTRRTFDDPLHDW
jgi:succinylglutamate desuccinylase